MAQESIRSLYGFFSMDLSSVMICSMSVSVRGLPAKVGAEYCALAQGVASEGGWYDGEIIRQVHEGKRYITFLPVFPGALVKFLPADRLERLVRCIKILPLFQIEPSEEVVGVRISRFNVENYPLSYYSHI